MILIRRSEERGDADHGWLHSKHTFSFAGYHDPKYMGVSDLRVINEDRISAGTGFSKHPHRDMEIISYVVSGALEHEDSMGNKTIIRPGDVQRMSAGSGILHSELNHLKDKSTHFFQIWIMPEKLGIAPSYGQKSFEEEFQAKQLTLVISQDGRDGSISINQDVDFYILKLKKNESLTFPLGRNRCLWAQVVTGNLSIGPESIVEGDGAFVSEVTNVQFSASEDSEVLIFDLRA